jgi:hypothetical protein
MANTRTTPPPSPRTETPPVRPPPTPPEAEAAARDEMPARRTRTLYVRVEDQVVWDQAKEIIGESLSTFLTNQLRRVVMRHEAQTHGADKILLQFRESGMPKLKSFFGRWLIPPDKPFYGEDLQDGPDSYAVAITPKANVVVFNFGQQLTSGKFDWGLLHVFKSFEAANDAEGIPYGLIAEAIEQLGLQVEELDI